MMVPCVKSNTKKHRSESITSSLQYIVVLGQCFALLPVQNVLSNTANNLRFKWWSFKTIYSIFALLGMGFLSLMAFVHVISGGHDFGTVVTIIVFYGGNSAVNVLFMILASNWSKLMIAWTKVDERMKIPYGYPNNLNRHLNRLTYLFIILALVEHSCSLIFRVLDTSDRYNGTVSINLFFKCVYPQVFDHINYSIYLAAIIQIITLLSVFTWTYCDLIIITLSTALVARFKQITARLRVSERTKDIVWLEIREDYDQLCGLCNTLNDSLTYIITLSYLINLYFILVQLFNSLRFSHGSVYSVTRQTTEKLYFTYSFGFLILRTVAVSIFAARINNESKEPVAILNSVPTSMFNCDVYRLLTQISFDNVALTGCDMFKITRGLILNIAGAIVTYELILIHVIEVISA